MGTILLVSSEVSMMKNQILLIVRSRGSVDNIELLLSLMTVFGPFAIQDDEYAAAINDLLESGDILRLEFTIHNLTDCIYFPKGTIFEFRGNRENQVQVRFDEESPSV